MTIRKTKPMIVLDVDGVLLDYSTAYAKAWAKAFGYHPIEVKPESFWPMERWGVPKLDGKELEQLRSAFDEEFWSTIPAMPDAVHACERLIDIGFELVCVTAMDPCWLRERKHNLQSLGFQVSEVYATSGPGQDGSNPKAPIVNSLRPIAFVEDFAPFLLGVSSDVHRALLTSDHTADSQQQDYIDSVHPTLLHFVEDWISKKIGHAGD